MRDSSHELLEERGTNGTAEHTRGVAMSTKGEFDGSSSAQLIVMKYK